MDTMSDEATEPAVLASQDDEEQSMNWSSVEMVAVNQAILSLTGQQPIDVAVPPGFLRSGGKTEPDDNDSQIETPPPPLSIDSA